jgi:hypothetical protein
MEPNRRRLLTTSLATAAAASLPSLSVAATPKKTASAKAASSAALAPTPPMGWNSWNSFGPTITEAQALENADIMVAKLLPFGYNVFTVDIQWYEPNANSYTYRKDAELTMDQYGRLQPAPNRFPSAAGGTGFKRLADQIHKRGMKFGIHLMRGIPRQAVRLNTPILGTNLRAQDIADTKAICEWNGDMYGVDMTKPGAQEYYNSVFKQYAEWGVDFVKMDDMSRPYERNWPEVEAAHKAIAASGRPIALSLAGGDGPALGPPRAALCADVAHLGRLLGRVAPARRTVPAPGKLEPGDGRELLARRRHAAARPPRARRARHQVHA